MPGATSVQVLILSAKGGASGETKVGISPGNKKEVGTLRSYFLLRVHGAIASVFTNSFY